MDRGTRYKTKTSRKMLNKLTIKEVRELLLGRKLKEMAHYLYLYHNGKRELLINEEAEKIANSILKSEKEKTIFKGIGVTKGIARGKALVLSQGSAGFEEKLKNEIRDKIIITSMVRKDIFHILQKSKAIVTDEGGLTSHASILARELRKPLVTGTKDATLHIKDGDTVEVDAENGVVRLINRNT